MENRSHAFWRTYLTKKTTVALPAVLAALIFAHLIFVMSYCLRHGRLSIVPFYDDVVYLSDGLERLAILDQGGVLGLVKSFFANPPHAPFSSVLALVGFALTPLSRVGAYALNGVWIFAFLALANRLLSTLPTAQRVSVLISILPIPIFATVIGVFRPDLYWGLLTGAVAIGLAAHHPCRKNWVETMLVGILVGLAALSKPTGMPAGLAVMGSGYLVSIVGAMTLRQATLRDIIKHSLCLIGGAALVTAPYLIVAWPQLSAYIWTVMSKEAAVWRTDGTFTFHALYYLRFDLLYSMVGWLTLVGPATAVFLVGVFIRRRDTRRLIEAAGVSVVLLIAFAIPTISLVKSAFIGSLFYGTFIATSIWLVGQALSLKPLPTKLVCGTSLAIFAAFWRPSVDYIGVEQPYYRAFNDAHIALLPALLKEISNSNDDQKSPVVYQSAPGPLFSKTLEFYALEKGLRAKFVGDYTSSNWNAVLASAQSADINIVSDPGSLGQGGGFSYPGIAFQAKLAGIFERDPKWRVLQTHLDHQQLRTIIFVKNERLKGTRLSFGLGFRDQEGPFADKGLPVFRWMIAETSRITIRRNPAQTAGVPVQLKCIAVVDVEVEIRDVNSVLTSTKQLTADTSLKRFETIEIPVNSPSQSFQIHAKSAAGTPTGWPGPMLCATDSGQ